MEAKEDAADDDNFCRERLSRAMESPTLPVNRLFFIERGHEELASPNDIHNYYLRWRQKPPIHRKRVSNFFRISSSVRSMAANISPRATVLPVVVAAVVILIDGMLKVWMLWLPLLTVPSG